MLTVDDFAAFVAEVHATANPGGTPRTPFPWQQALMERIVADGRWPDEIDVPTGLGKTAVLDVALFVAALRPELARRRVFFVVDRRLVVDEAYEHARQLADALRDATTPVCRAVAQALRVPGDDGDGPVTVARMHGGVTWDRIWLERPDRFAVITGTVDQVGSRLLFRGYGVSEYARAIDAALVGTDSLIVVDEAHLAAAFRTTVTAALGQDGWPVAPRPALVTMSATSAPATGRTGSRPEPVPLVHRIGADDHTHPVAGGRLRARKRLRLLEVRTTRKKAATDLPRALAELAAGLATGGVVGVVVNTVSRARAVFDLLDSTTEAILLTGRSRQVDRDMLLDRHYDRIKVGRDRTDRRPFVVVATQTIEVGANIDLDALVTDSAPLPALVQRLGRLNRLGTHETPVPAYVVHDSSADDEDPVYGPARLAAWRWLTEQAPVGSPSDLAGAGEGVDASPIALRKLVAAAPEEANRTRQPYVPVLNGPTLDAWVRTSPTPHPDPPVGPFLHGLTDEAPAVTVLWRSDLPMDAPQRWQAVVDLVPPMSGESIDVPAGAIRRWLRSEPETDAPVADIDIAEPEAYEEESATGPVTPAGQPKAPRVHDERGQPLVLRYSRSGEGQLIPAHWIRPGDTIVVPTDYGGCDRYGWHPAGRTPVVDVADLARRSDRPLLRIGPHLRDVARHTAALAAQHDAQVAEPVATGSDDRSDPLGELLDFAATNLDADQPDQYRDLLARLAASLTPTDRSRRLVESLIRGLRRGSVTTTRQIDNRTGVSWTPAFPVVLTTARAWSADDDSEAASSGTAYPGRRITLDAHQIAVANRAAEMARNLGLPERIVASVEAAARWHDEGKRDIRFQTMLFAGRRVAAELAAAPLAKSGLDPANRAEARRVRVAAGFPAGMRHEALSARIAALRLAEPRAGGGILDRDLVLHLIATHHGRSRPLLPPVVDPDPVKVAVSGMPVLDTSETIDWQGPARFARLNDDYGRWGLALLETIVRLADIWCSVRNEEAATK